MVRPIFVDDYDHRVRLNDGGRSYGRFIIATTVNAVSVGALIAFRAPSAAYPYADGHMAYLRRVPVLKHVAAVSGDQVCTANGRLEINGRVRAPILRQDRRGAALPRWRGCRRLRDGEVFVFSDRIPNSFDSRYFGPVSHAEIVGVFRPLAIPHASPGDR